MNTAEICLQGATFEATATRALYWQQENLIVVSDLHLGKSERFARKAGLMLPPYETQDTLIRLEDLIHYFNPRSVICLGDSFDDPEAGRNLSPDAIEKLNSLMAGRDWIWIEGNHDPGPVEFTGKHLAHITISGVTFRHIASTESEFPEISGHFHPKARVAVRGRTMTRPCFLFDQNRLIMPSFGTYTGGLFSNHETLKQLMRHDAKAVLTGVAPHIIPMPR